MLKFAAEHGIPAAQNRYGLLLKYGMGVPLDLVAAGEWFSKAEAQGDLDSTAHLTNLQLSGDWIPADPEAFHARLVKAAESGNPYALAELANILMKNSPHFTETSKMTKPMFQKAYDGFKKDQNDFYVQFYLGVLSLILLDSEISLTAAHEWFKKSAEQGLWIAQIKVGEMLWNGHGVPRDPISGSIWYEKAAINGHTNAQFILGFALYSGEKIPRDLDAAYKWLIKAAFKGHAQAQACLATMYLRGQAVKQDTQTAIKWYLEAANHGDGYAQAILADIYFQGSLVPRDLGKAFKFATKGAAQKNRLACRVLGEMYFNGLGIPQDLVKSAKFYGIAARRGDSESQKSLAIMHLTGMGVPRNKSKALSLLKKSTNKINASELTNLAKMLFADEEDPLRHKNSFFVCKVAAKLGDCIAMRLVGLTYLTGMGVPQNVEKAKKWLTKAAKHGDPFAKKTLQENFSFNPDDPQNVH
jgi:TPR repeat protein